MSLTLLIQGAVLLAGATTSFIGGQQSAAAAKQISKLQQGIIEQEMEANKVRRDITRLKTKRNLQEIGRQSQRARALGLAAATNQGASKGSGLQGAYGQVSGQTGVNILGQTQFLGFAEHLYEINNQISRLQSQIAAQGGKLAEGQGLSQLGGSLMAAAPTIGNILGGFGNQTTQQA